MHFTDVKELVEPKLAPYTGSDWFTTLQGSLSPLRHYPERALVLLGMSCILEDASMVSVIHNAVKEVDDPMLLLQHAPEGAKLLRRRELAPREESILTRTARNFVFPLPMGQSAAPRPLPPPKSVNPQGGRRSNIVRLPKCSSRSAQRSGEETVAYPIDATLCNAVDDDDVVMVSAAPFGAPVSSSASLLDALGQHGVFPNHLRTVTAGTVVDTNFVYSGPSSSSSFSSGGAFTAPHNSGSAPVINEDDEEIPCVFKKPRLGGFVKRSLVNRQFVSDDKCWLLV